MSSHRMGKADGNGGTTVTHPKLNKKNIITDYNTSNGILYDAPCQFEKSNYNANLVSFNNIILEPFNHSMHIYIIIISEYELLDCECVIGFWMCYSQLFLTCFRVE